MKSLNILSSAAVLTLILGCATDPQTRSLKAQYTEPMKHEVDALEDQNAKKLVPKSLDETKERIKAADKTIEKNNKDMNAVMAQVNAARSSLDQTKVLLNLAKTTKASSPEETANVILQKQQRNESLNTMLSKSESDRAQAEKESTDLEGRMARQKEYIANLQKRFDSNDAEVYQQGEAILVRLKGIQFKSGTSEIPVANASLLEGVKSIIKETSNPSVVVEGHTDAIGSSAKNQVLSQERADSIKRYLDKDSSLNAGQIVAKGYGAEKPIASNKTKDGRTQNRRVDVIIRKSDAGMTEHNQQPNSDSDSEKK